jgi:hypothetical protein
LLFFVREEKKTKIWERIYHDYQNVKFPNSFLKEDTLKQHLKEQLAEIKTSIADDKNTSIL